MSKLAAGLLYGLVQRLSTGSGHVAIHVTLFGGALQVRSEIAENLGLPRKSTTERCALE